VAFPRIYSFAIAISFIERQSQNNMTTSLAVGFLSYTKSEFSQERVPCTSKLDSSGCDHRKSTSLKVKINRSGKYTKSFVTTLAYPLKLYSLEIV
jgi:hypothetical protein